MIYYIQYQALLQTRKQCLKFIKFLEKYTMAEINHNDKLVEKITEMSGDIKYMRQEITDVKSWLENKYVTVSMFAPVQKIVYGLVGLILTSVVVALIAMVIQP